MRKLTIHIKPNNFLDHLGKIFNIIEKGELVEVVHMDFGNLTELNIVKVKLQPGKTLEHIEELPGVEITGVLEEHSKTEFTCLMKKTIDKQFQKLANEFKLDLIYDKPTYFTEKEIVYSCIGDEKNLNKFIEKSKFMGEITKIIFKKHTYGTRGSLNNLTEKQKKIFKTAKESGYYEYPRKTTSEKLANKIGIKKSTLIEHLRRIENKIFSSIN